MFCVEKLYPEMLENYIVKSISTDGYTISLIFTGKDVQGKYTKGEKRPSAQVKKYQEGVKFTASKLLKTDKLEPGLYDATKLRMKPEDLDKCQIAGLDPGNGKMLNIMKSNGEMFTVTKGYYNEISHITRNIYKKQKAITDDDRISSINQALSNTCIRSASLTQYVAYMRIIVANWNYLWKYHQGRRFCVIKYDTYLGSKRAIARVCREVREELPVSGDKRPVILAFGNGNGNMTINNTKNSSAHGPIKRIAKALSLKCRVVITDEYNTSKLCSDCNAVLKHPKTHNTESVKKMYKRLFGIKMPRIKKAKNFMARIFPQLEQKVIVNKRSYALCCCKSKDHSDDNRLRNRDYHGSANIRRVFRARVTGKIIPAFVRPKKDVQKTKKKSPKKSKKKHHVPKSK
jgi:hypothetical protein